MAGASLFDLTAGLQSAVDQHVARHGGPTDVGEMAQQAAGEALISLAGDNAITLFGGGGEYLKSALRSLSTKSGFARLGHVFFARFLSRFLGFYLSRVAASATGTDRLPSVAELTRLNSALQAHCEEIAQIVRGFCGQWYSRAEHLEGIEPQQISRFVAVAMRKLAREVAARGAET